MHLIAFSIYKLNKKMIKKISLFLLLIMAFSYLSYSQLVSTYAGNGGTTQCTNGVQKLLCPFAKPWGVAVDSKGRIWITEEGAAGQGYGHTIKVILTDGTVYTRAGAYGMPGFKNGFGAGTTRFSGPRGIAVGAGDTLYIADCGNHLIRKLAPFTSVGNAQEATVFAGSNGTGGGTPGYLDGAAGVAKFNQPSDLAIDASGNVYVVEEGNHCIRKITKNGTVSTFAGVPQSSGYLDGAKLSAKFNFPTGICIATNGDIYVADNFGSRIRKISGTTVSTLGNVTMPPLYQPNDVALDGTGILYATDENRVFKFTGSVISDFAGPHDPNQSGMVNASGTAARFYNAKGIIVDPANNNIIYVADQDNNLIRKIVICNLAKPSVTVAGALLTCSLTATSYKWYKNGTLITTATSKTYTVTQTGDYKVEITDANGCTNISDQVHVVVSSVIEFNNKITFEIYPNPSTGIFTMNINTLKQEKLTFSIFDMLGHIVYHKDYFPVSGSYTENFDFSGFQKGIYFVRVQSGENVGAGRIVLQ